MRQTIIRLILSESGASAVEDGIVLGIFGAMILAGAPVIGSSVGGLCHAIGKISRPDLDFSAGKYANFGQPR